MKRFCIIGVTVVVVVSAIRAKQDPQPTTTVSTVPLIFEKSDGNNVVVKGIHCTPPTQHSGGLSCFVDESEGILYISFAPATEK